MVLVMTTSYFPANKAAEAGKNYLEGLKKIPRDKSLAKTILPVGARVTQDGVKAISIAEVKEGKFIEYMENVHKRLLFYSGQMEEYRVEVEVFMSGAEALSLVGLEPPE